MSKNRRFLQRQRVNLVFTFEDNLDWIALKPLCKSSGLSWDYHKKKLKKGSIFSKLVSKKQFRVSHQNHEMVGLADCFILFWLFNAHSTREKLNELKRNILIDDELLSPDHLRDFLRMQGIKPVYSIKDGRCWIALKPLCESLNVTWNKPYKELCEGSVFSDYIDLKYFSMSGFDYYMLGMEDRLVLLWLFSINSLSKKLKKLRGAYLDTIWNMHYPISLKIVYN